MSLQRSARRLVLAITVAAVGGWVLSSHDRETEGEEIADRETETASIPHRHQELREKLNREIHVDFDGTPLREVLRSLSQLLGARVYLDPESVKAGKFTTDFGRQPTDQPAEMLDVKVTMKEGAPVVAEAALRQLLNFLGQGDYTFDENGICLIANQAEGDRYAIRSYDLGGFSDYSTVKRQRLIEQVRTNVASTTWAQPSGPWIMPSRNVFTVDVYQTLDNHVKIAEYLLQIQHHDYITLYKDVGEIQNLMISFGREQSPDRDQKLEELIKRLRKEYDYKSLVERLKYESRPMAREMGDPQLSESAQQRLEQREQPFVAINPGGELKRVPWVKVRAESLRQLHEEEVSKFISREGFGLSRMPSPGPSQVPQPRTVPLPLVSAEIKGWEGAPLRLPKTEGAQRAGIVVLPAEDTLTEFHHYSEDNFLAPQSFGYVKDRDHVAGFRSHAFEYAPQLRWVKSTPWYQVPVEHWALHRLELVSLLKHDQPAVYLSSNLPRMDELVEAKIRPLGEFEADALAQLHQGEDVVTRATINRIEMVGSLRATKQCIDCHDVKRGQLLGAFSYELLRDPAIQPE